jgi:23S rRNA (uridine2552-2'-O)-methyltransferase
MKSRSQQNKYKSADFYARKAKKEEFAARSVYKLKEIQQKYHLIGRGDKVLDLGCAPGSWLQYAAEEVGNTGRVLGIDLNEVNIAISDHVRVICGDVFDLADHKENMAQAIGSGYQVVLSDMAPSTTGHKETDSARSYQLCSAALAIAAVSLAPGGSFVCKIFQGGDFEEFVRSVRSAFDKVKIFKPQSCRKESKEIYVIGTGKKQEGL